MTRHLVLAAVLFAAGCVTYETTLREFDSVAGHDREAVLEPASLTYRDSSDRYPWLVRQIEGIGGGAVVNDVFDFERAPWEVENPAGFARDRIVDMVDVAGNDLVRLSEVAWRLLLVIDRDESALNRALAVEALGTLIEAARSSRVSPAEPGFQVEPDADAVFRKQAESLVAALDAAWPRAEREPDGRTERQAYVAALRDLSRLDAGTLGVERSRLRAMIEAFEAEPDADLRQAAAGFLKESLRSALNRGLASALTDPDSHVREAALFRLSQAGGPAILPWIVWRLHEHSVSLLPAAERSRATVDPDPAVRRRLLLLTWVLDLEGAKTAHAGGPSPLEFVVDTALNDENRSLRLGAREVLAFFLRRNVDPEAPWIADWWKTFVTEGRGKA